MICAYWTGGSVPAAFSGIRVNTIVRITSSVQPFSFAVLRKSLPATPGAEMPCRLVPWQAAQWAMNRPSPASA